MEQSRTQQTEIRLRRLRGISPAIEDCWLASSDGFFMANALPLIIDDDSHSPRSAIAMSLAECIAHACGIGTLQKVCVGTKAGDIILISVGTIAVMAIQFNKTDWHESLFEDIAATVEDLKNIWHGYNPLPFD